MKTTNKVNKPIRTMTNLKEADVTEEVKPSTELATTSDSIPEYMRGDAGKGTENIDQSDMEIPRLKLIQALSPELEQYKDLRPGMFFHTAEELVLPGTINVVPVYIARRALLWNPRDNGGGILARADDGKRWEPSNAEFSVKLDRKDGGAAVKWNTKRNVVESGLLNWGSLNPEDKQSPPAGTLMYDYVVMFPDYKDLSPAVFTFQRSSLKAGKKFNQKLGLGRIPIFGTKWKLSAIEATNRSGQKFFNVSVSGNGFVVQEIYEKYKELNRSFNEAGYKLSDEESLREGEDLEENETEENGKPSY